MNALLLALLKCRSVRLTTNEARSACSGVTTIVSERGTTYRRWSHPARPEITKVRLCGSGWVSVNCRQRRGEPIEALLWRALAELSRREASGMPKPDPKAKRRRALRKLLDTADVQRPM